MSDSQLFAGVEGGGTKFVCAVGDGRSPTLLARATFPTLATHDDTLSACIEWLRARQDELGPFAGVGVGTFGPIELNAESPAYGRITSTPKPGWTDADIVSAFRRAFDAPIGFDTDVNAAALGEFTWGAGRGASNLVYITIGTGIGGGALVNGQPLHGLIHPEMGHMRIGHNLAEDDFRGACPYHGDCWEGLCCGPALEARTGQRAETLSRDHPAWPLTAHYTGQAFANISLTLSPHRIILGGSVPKGGQFGADAFMALVRAETARALNGYLREPMLLERMDDYIVPPGLGDNAGVCGAIVLAMRAKRAAGSTA